MNHRHDAWQSLTSQARTATPAAADTSAPLGFATRVVAQWRAAQENPTFAFWQRWSLRGACAAMMAYALVATWSAGNPAPESIPVLDMPGLPGL